MRRSTGAHVIFGVNLEEATPAALSADCSQVLVLEAGPGEAADRQCGKAERNGHRRGRFGCCVHVIVPLSASRSSRPSIVSDRLKRAVLAVRQLDVGAGAALDEFPCIALEVSGRRALAGRAGT